jgi:protein-S-isoprenylcysteine O-methyltransferase Ste14
MTEAATHDPRDETLTKAGKVYIVRDHMAVVIHVALLLATARTLLWFNAWVMAGALLAIKSGSALVLTRVNPAVLNARGTKRELSRRERLFFAVLVPSSLALPIVAGLDVGAAGWTHRGIVEFGLGLSLALAGGALSIWALAVNAFFEPSVRLQSDRGHRVCTTGPYRFVRHPGYVGAMLVSFSLAFVVGSRWALIPAAVQALALIVRTGYEDRMLRESLAGYADYAEQTRARLLPGIW